ncbi:hypothetical protein VNI00_014415 [Paramarasmius palmivorus]|uniref:histidine kinase n=1 Tax=Paramarasmius palmivorus TaxID=297713 RepID=A0AAW0BSD7_9AGAR
MHFTSDSLPLYRVSSKRRLRVDFEETRTKEPLWTRIVASLQRAWQFAIHAPTGSPSDGMGDGSESTSSTAAWVASQKQLTAEKDGDNWKVDEVVVTGEVDHVVKIGSERTTTGSAGSPGHSDTDSIHERRHGSPSGSGAYRPPSIRTKILGVWDHVYMFFDASFDDKNTESDFRKLNWYSTKSFAFYGSLYLILNWIFYLWLNRDSTSKSLYAQAVYYGGLTLFTAPLPFLVAFDFPLRHPKFFQVWFAVAVWWCGVTEIIQIKLCNFFGAGGRRNCDGKDFLAMLYYITAVPALMLFLMSHRFPTVIMMVLVLILIGVLIMPDQAIFARNMVSYALFSIFLLGLHHNKEMADRRLYLLNSQLKVAYKAQQKAQMAQSKASQAKRRFASYIFHEVRVPLNNAAIAFNNLVTNDAFKNFTTNSAFYNLTTTSAYHHMTGNEKAFAKEAPHADAEDAVALQVSLTQVQQVLNDSLDLDKMDAGHFDINPRPFPLHSVMRSTLAPLIVTAVNKNLQLKLNFDHRIDQLVSRLNSGESQQKQETNGHVEQAPLPKADSIDLEGGYPPTPGFPPTPGSIPTPSSWSAPLEARDYISHVSRTTAPHSSSSPTAAFTSIFKSHQRAKSSDRVSTGSFSQTATPAPPDLSASGSTVRGTDELWVIGDEVRLRQILTNLVSNAVKFTPAGAAEGVTVSTELLTVVESVVNEQGIPPMLGRRKSSKESKHSAEAGRSEKEAKLEQKAPQDMVVFRIEINDSGPGIKPSDLVDYQLFHPFAQAIGKLSKNSSGLGLAIVRQIVTLSGGKLGVKSAKGKGATFWVELSYPIARKQSVQFGTDANSVPPPSSPPKAVPVDETERWPVVAFADDVKPPMLTGAITPQSFPLPAMSLPLPPLGPQHRLSGSTLTPGSTDQATYSKLLSSPSEAPATIDEEPRNATIPAGTPPIEHPPPPQSHSSTSGTTPDRDPPSTVEASDLGNLPTSTSPSKTTFLHTLQHKTTEESGDTDTQVLASERSSSIKAKKKATISSDDQRPLLALIVEDNFITRNVMTRYLKGRGCIVHTASDGKEALDRVLSEDAPEYDIISMDNDMPHMTGEDAVREIRRAGKDDLFIIGVTGSALSEDQRNFLAAGVNRVVAKPFNPVIRSTTSLFNAPPSPTHSRNDSIALEQETLSAADEVLRQCPRFRILVLGKSGAGKSSLINATFNVDLATVSHDIAGVSDINQEITSEQNPRFVLHDSQGFAHGETVNFNTVKAFIDERSRSTLEIKDRLHAIWFCVEIPTENGALFERGDEEILNLSLGNVPIIVVFTKYDGLISKLERETEDDDELDDEQFEAVIDSQAEEEFMRTCVTPLRAMTEHRKSGPIPFMRTSINIHTVTETRYKNTLQDLVGATRDKVDRAVWLTWALAQRANADLKIEASIEIGRKKYWRGLASSLHFPGMTLEKCLDAIHEEIIMIWNFNDPKMRLSSSDFKKAIFQLVDELSDRPSTRVRKILSMTGLVGMVGAAAPGPAAVITIPIAGAIVLAQWIHLVYQETPSVIRMLMAYIVGMSVVSIHASEAKIEPPSDLTIIMQSLFWLTQARGIGYSITKPDLRLAFAAYADCDDGECSKVHAAIKAFVPSSALFRISRRDEVLNKVVDLIQAFRFTPSENFKKYQSSIPILDDDQDFFFADPLEYIDSHQTHD